MKPKEELMKNIHVLPTEKPSSYVTNYMEQNMQWQHIYITSDEEIKEGDYGVIGEVIMNYSQMHKMWNMPQGKKIILTTDTDLINDGVQAIDDEFLEWFVKNSSREFVNFISYGNEKGTKDYELIIPQEEPKMIECYFIPSNNTSSATICGNCGKEKFLHTIGSGIKVSKSIIITQTEPKQEPLEEAACKALGYDYNDWVSLFSKDKSTVIYSEVTNWCKGAKYMAERMYSEEDLRYAFECATDLNPSFKTFSAWFEQFKNK